MESGQKAVVLARAIQATFSASEWTELANITDCTEWVHAHPRLLRSLYWRDHDYKGNVINAVTYILKRHPANLARLLEYGPITRWLAENDRESLARLRTEVAGIPPAVSGLVTSSQVALGALAEAQSLLNTRGPASAIGRVHAGLHEFLKAACSEAGLPFPVDAGPNRLLEIALAEHPALNYLGPHAGDVRRILRSAGAVIDALDSLGNNVGGAHPANSVLDDEAALLAINLARSVLRYLDAKLALSPPF